MDEKVIIIQNKIIELINSFKENKQLIENSNEIKIFENIIEKFNYAFVTNKNNISIIIENKLTKIRFNKNNTFIEIVPQFTPLHLTGSFTYCTGKLKINGLEYNFNIYEYNTYTWEYNIAKNNNGLAFCYFDMNDKNFAYFNVYKINEIDIFTVNKHKNMEYFLEKAESNIMKKIYYKQYFEKKGVY
jgi:hypothetical protein